MLDPNYIRAESRSFSLLEKYGIVPPDFDIKDLAFVMGIEVAHGGISDADAWLVRCDDGKGIIRLSSSITEGVRERFSIAHELGHWELHPDTKQGYLCTGKNLRDYGRSPEEAEANWFAATLLMPRFLIPDLILKRDPDFAFIRNLAKDFRTSLTAAARRFVELSKQPVVLVSSSNNQVDWIARSKSAGYYFVQPGNMVPQYSLTAEAVAASRSESPMEKMDDPHIWFPDLNFSEDSELFESVRYSTELDNALTLLWILA
ncbi:MAG: ImmA/IrrE family metallo-endopeptidase [Opitutaceae bacterium]|jgi:hypothetical protein